MGHGRHGFSSNAGDIDAVFSDLRVISVSGTESDLAAFQKSLSRSVRRATSAASQVDGNSNMAITTGVAGASAEDLESRSRKFAPLAKLLQRDLAGDLASPGPVATISAGVLPSAERIIAKQHADGLGLNSSLTATGVKIEFMKQLPYEIVVEVDVGDSLSGASRGSVAVVLTAVLSGSAVDSIASSELPGSSMPTIDLYMVHRSIEGRVGGDEHVVLKQRIGGSVFQLTTDASIDASPSKPRMVTATVFVPT